MELIIEMRVNAVGSHHALRNHREPNSNASQDIKLQQVTAAGTRYQALVVATAISEALLWGKQGLTGQHACCAALCRT
jgi:hypothetical protein